MFSQISNVGHDPAQRLGKALNGSLTVSVPKGFSLRIDPVQNYEQLTNL